MDFDSIIVFIFIFVFFVLPSILKQVKARKKKTGAGGKKAGVRKEKKKAVSIFGRIGDQIRDVLQEIETQAQQQKKTTKEQGTIWETLAEEEPLFSDVEMPGEDVDVKAAESFDSPKIPGPEPRENPLLSGNPARSFPKDYRLKSDPLQNAIIWSEILSKPVALRKE